MFASEATGIALAVTGTARNFQEDAIMKKAVDNASNRPKAPDVRVLHAMMRGAQGQAIEPPPAVKAAMAAQRNRVARAGARLSGAMPEWFQRITGTGMDSAAIVKAVVAHALQVRDDETLLEVRAVLNELGRNPQTAAEVFGAITVEALDQLKQ
jgi:protein-disulfide isomerase-like protein with CxxC motif